MARSQLTPIDSVLGAIKAIIVATEAVREVAKCREIACEEAVARATAFDKACKDFHAEGHAMQAVTVDLANRGYDDSDFSFTNAAGTECFNAAGMMAIYQEVDRRRVFLAGDTFVGQHLLKCAHSLQKALQKARKWLKAQKQIKRKPKDDVYLWLSATEAAHYIGPTYKTINEWINKAGTLQTYGKIGAKYKFLKSELDAKKEIYKRRKPSKTGD